MRLFWETEAPVRGFEVETAEPEPEPDMDLDNGEADADVSREESETDSDTAEVELEYILHEDKDRFLGAFTPEREMEGAVQVQGFVKWQSYYNTNGPSPIPTPTTHRRAFTAGAMTGRLPSMKYVRTGFKRNYASRRRGGTRIPIPRTGPYRIQCRYEEWDEGMAETAFEEYVRRSIIAALWKYEYESLLQMPGQEENPAVQEIIEKCMSSLYPETHQELISYMEDAVSFHDPCSVVDSGRVAPRFNQPAGAMDMEGENPYYPWNGPNPIDIWLDAGTEEEEEASSTAYGLQQPIARTSGSGVGHSVFYYAAVTEAENGGEDSSSSSYESESGAGAGADAPLDHESGTSASPVPLPIKIKTDIFLDGINFDREKPRYTFIFQREAYQDLSILAARYNGNR